MALVVVFPTNNVCPQRLYSTPVTLVTIVTSVGVPGVF